MLPTLARAKFGRISFFLSLSSCNRPTRQKSEIESWLRYGCAGNKKRVIKKKRKSERVGCREREREIKRDKERAKENENVEEGRSAFLVSPYHGSALVRTIYIGCQREKEIEKGI